MFVVIDTNVWISELGLNSNAGSALRYFMHQQGALLALPEVIRLEVQKHLRADLCAARSGIEKHHRRLLAIFGQIKAIVLPSDEQIEERVQSFFDGVGLKVRDVSFSLESARSSFIRTIDKVAPSTKNQQFKDGVIWADCMKLLAEDDVAFVTADSAFFEDHEPSKGLASTLLSELEGKGHQLTIHAKLADLLKSIRRSVTIDENALANAVDTNSKESMRRLAERTGFTIAAKRNVTRRVYITEQVERLFVEFEIAHECEDASGAGRIDAVLTSRGTCILDDAVGHFDAIAIGEEDLRWARADGSEESARNSYATGEIHIGHRDARHRVRHEV